MNQFLFGLCSGPVLSCCLLPFHDLLSIIGDHIPGCKMNVAINQPGSCRTIAITFRNNMGETYYLTDSYHFHDVAWLSGDPEKIYRMLGISKIIRWCRKNCCTVPEFFLASDSKTFYQWKCMTMLHGWFPGSRSMTSLCRKMQS